MFLYNFYTKLINHIKTLIYLNFNIHNMEDNIIYLDNADTTKVFKEVSEIIHRYNEELFFNPSGIYRK